MKETVLTSAGAAYEPPYAEIIEFAVERGFTVSGDSYDSNNGTEVLGREEEGDFWHS